MTTALVVGGDGQRHAGVVMSLWRLEGDNRAWVVELRPYVSPLQRNALGMMTLSSVALKPSSQHYLVHVEHSRLHMVHVSPLSGAQSWAVVAD